VIVLVRLGVHDDRMIDTGCVHAFQKLFRSCRFRRLVGRARVVREARVAGARETMQVRIDEQRTGGISGLEPARRGGDSTAEQTTRLKKGAP
jgi:hypothetical protein